jgi:hypothetical protein
MSRRTRDLTMASPTRTDGAGSVASRPNAPDAQYVQDGSAGVLMPTSDTTEAVAPNNNAAIVPNRPPKRTLRTPLQAVKARCRECIGDGVVRDCAARDCPLWGFRFGLSLKTAKRRGRIPARHKPCWKTAMRALRAYCLECSGGSWLNVKLCPRTDCPCWHLRFGMRSSTAAKRGYPIDASEQCDGRSGHRADTLTQTDQQCKGGGHRAARSRSSADSRARA